MFLKKEDIKAKIRKIILDEKDNDIAFVVAAKGVGKLDLLEEIYDFESLNSDVIVANGKRINNSSSCIEKCYIDGICSYIERNDSLKTREDFLRQLPNGKLTARQRWSFLCKAFVSEDKCLRCRRKNVDTALQQAEVIRQSIIKQTFGGT